jgi:predicted transcriptional regulator
MKAVARGEKQASRNAGEQSFDSVAALLRLLTPDNRRLLAIIRDRKPQSIAELATYSGRAAPNVTRTLSKLEAVGFVRLDDTETRKKVPTAIVHKFTVEIDPFSQNDHLEVS